MKMSPELLKAQDNMRPGIITSDGFLGDEDSMLVDLLERDDELLSKEGIDIEAAVTKMRRLLQDGCKGLGEPITVDNTWIVRTEEARGKIPCPFEDGVFQKINCRIENIHNGKHLFYTHLSTHLLDKHHFLEGTGSPFRIEPSLLKAVLEL